MILWRQEIQLLSPLFCRGANQDAVELRVPSIRGMVRWWFRQLQYSAKRPTHEIRKEENAIFGAVHGTTIASSVVFRIVEIRHQQTGNYYLLPHKDKPVGNRKGFKEGLVFRLEVTKRFDLDETQTQNLRNSLDVWLLLGSLGARGNRGAGSVWPNDNAPANPEELRERLDRAACTWPFMIASTQVGSSAQDLRKAASDTIKGDKECFGFVGSHGERLASPLKMKIVKFDHQLRLLITAPSIDILKKAQSSLKNKRSKPDSWEGPYLSTRGRT